MSFVSDKMCKLEFKKKHFANGNNMMYCIVSFNMSIMNFRSKISIVRDDDIFQKLPMVRQLDYYINFIITPIPGHKTINVWQ